MKRKKTEDYINQVKKVHGDKYDYSLINYVNRNSKIKIICRKHGVFEKTARYFLNGAGCPKCKEEDFIENFIKKANNIYNKFYDYSLVDNISGKIKIICKKHGVFKTTTFYHLNGMKCPECEKEKKINDFINKLNKIHNYKYNYSLVTDISKSKIIKVICPKHGVFEIKKAEHLKGYGCFQCLKNNKFIEKAKKIYNDQYDYSISEYKTSSSKIKIICKKHGIFEITPHKHLKYGCFKCKKEKKDILTFENGIEYLKKHNKKKYDYSLVKFEKNKKIEVICLKHGKFFIDFKLHLNGKICPECKKDIHEKNMIEIRKKQILNEKEKQIKKAKKIYNNKYDYSLVKYKSFDEKVKIICPEHGIFEQSIKRHLKFGCVECRKNKRKIERFEKFINQAKKNHGDKYRYDLINKDTVFHEQLNIICSIHGKFQQLEKYFLLGSGCPECYLNNKIEEYIQKSKKIHNDEYDYKLIDKKDFPNGKIICPKHGIFKQSLSYHSKGRKCPKCSNSISERENEIAQFIKDNYDGKIVLRNRKIIGLELDIYLPELKLAFEYNGLYWHSEINKDKNYHFLKTEYAEKKKIHLIQIYGDDWELKQNIVKSRILNLLGKNEKIYARKCEIKIIESSEKKKFLEENHLQGNINSKINIGLFYKNELVSVMTFGNMRKALGAKKKDLCFELLRFCNKINFSVIGGASKLFNYFIKNYEYKQIISYADRSWTMLDKNLYSKLNFKFKEKTQPNYYYIFNNVRKHRFNFRKDVLIKQGFDKNKTEHEIMLERKIYRIYNSGNLKYSLKI